MDAQEAISELKYQEDMRAKDIPYRVTNLVIAEAVAALEKQIPVKPKPYKGWEGQCPDCGVVFVDRLAKFCGNCGKALCWEDA